MTNSPTTTPSLPVWETLRAAWAKVSGVKGSIWGGIIITALIAVGCGILQHFFQRVMVVELAMSILTQLIMILLQAGLVYIGIRRAFDLPFSYDFVFRGFDLNIGLRVIGAYILQFLIILIPCILLFIATIIQPSIPLLSSLLYVIAILGIIYLLIRLLLVIPFVIDKVVSPVQAIKASFQATRHHFWSLLCIVILTWIFLAICAIPFGIGLIWGFPFAFVVTGIVYKRLSTGISL